LRRHVIAWILIFINGRNGEYLVFVVQNYDDAHPHRQLFKLSRLSVDRDFCIGINRMRLLSTLRGFHGELIHAGRYHDALV